jgi:hypothetical protein
VASFQELRDFVNGFIRPGFGPRVSREPDLPERKTAEIFSCTGISDTLREATKEGGSKVNHGRR